AGLLGLFAVLWPRRLAAAQSAPSGSDAELVDTAPLATYERHFRTQLMRRVLWTAAVVLVALVAGLTVFAQSAAGVHDAERYASVLFGPVVILVLAAWPVHAPRWLGQLLLGLWLLGLAFRAGHVAHDLRRVPPLAPASVASPGLHR
ncbi:hypothetical protein, partial [Hymenobacter agri]